MSVSGDSPVLSTKKGILVSLLSRQCGHKKPYNVLRLLCDSGFDMELFSSVYRCHGEADWSFCEALWHRYDFDTEVMSCIKASSEPGWKP